MRVAGHPVPEQNFGEFNFVAFLPNLFLEAQELFLCASKDFKEVCIHHWVIFLLLLPCVVFQYNEWHS